MGTIIPELTHDQLTRFAMRLPMGAAELAYKTLAGELERSDIEKAQAAVDDYPRGELVPAFLVALAGANAASPEWRAFAREELIRGAKAGPCRKCRGAGSFLKFRAHKITSYLCPACAGTGVEP